MIKLPDDNALYLLNLANQKKAMANQENNPSLYFSEAILLCQLARECGLKENKQKYCLSLLREGICRFKLAENNKQPIQNLHLGILLQQQARKEGLSVGTFSYAESFFNEGIASISLAKLKEDPRVNYKHSIVCMSKARDNGYNKNTPKYGNSLFNQGTSLIELAKLGDNPIENLESAITILEKARKEGLRVNSKEFAFTYFHQGRAYASLAGLGVNPKDNCNLAIHAQQQARRSGLLENSSGFGVSLRNEGIAYSILALFEDPEKNYKLGIELQIQSREAGLRKKTSDYAGSLENEGHMRSLLAEIGIDSISNLQLAINLQKRAREEGYKPNTENFASTFLNQGIAHTTLSLYGINPIENFYRSIELNQKARVSGLIENTPSYAHTYINEAYARQGLACYGENPKENLEIAIDLEQKARKLLLKKSVDYASTLLNEGNFWGSLVQYVDQPKIVLEYAINCYREARENGLIKGTRAYGLTSLNEAYAIEDLVNINGDHPYNYNDIFDLIQEARSCGLIEESTEYGIALAFEGNILRALADQGIDPINNNQTAILRYNKALDIFRETDSKIDEASILKVLAYLKRKSGAIEESYDLLKQSANIIENLRKSVRIPDFRKNTYEKLITVFHNIVYVCFLLDKNEEAFRYAEYAKGRTFLELLAADKKKIHGNVELVEEYSSILNKIDELEFSIAKIEEDELSGNQKEILESNRAQLHNCYTQIQSILHQIKVSDPEYHSIATVEPVSINDVKELIQGNTLVEYFLTEKLLAFVINDELKVINLEISDKELINKVKELKNIIKSLEDEYSVYPKNNERLKIINDKALLLLNELYNILITPLKPYLKENLIIVPHNVLHYIPFQALFNDRFLIDEYSIKFAQSASSLLYQKEGTADSALVVGDPNGDLENACIEAINVAKVLEVKPLIQQEATKEKIVSEILNKNILHFACHAYYNYQFPMFSGIVLKDSKKITAHEFMNFDLNTELTVLSACESAIGKISLGDEIEGLIRAIQCGGSHYVIGSLWSVDDYATSKIFQTFYNNLGDPAEGLRNSILDFKKKSTDSSFYLWAPFQIYGF